MIGRTFRFLSGSAGLRGLVEAHVWECLRSVRLSSTDLARIGTPLTLSYGDCVCEWATWGSCMVEFGAAEAS